MLYVYICLLYVSLFLFPHFSSLCSSYSPPLSCQFDEKLGNGAYKEVYLSYDTETGKEVAWNTVNLTRLPPGERKRIRMETEILRELNHPHVINFYHVWESEDKEKICFTTEIVTSGTLKQYVNRLTKVKLKVIKK